MEIERAGGEPEVDARALQLREEHVGVVGVSKVCPGEVDLDGPRERRCGEHTGQFGSHRSSDAVGLVFVEGDRRHRVARPRGHRAGAGEQARGEHHAEPSGHGAEPCREVRQGGRTGDQCDRGKCPDRPHPIVVLRHEPEHRNGDQGRTGQSGDERDDRGDPRRRGGRAPDRHPATATAAPATHSRWRRQLPRCHRRTGAQNGPIDPGCKNGPIDPASQNGGTSAPPASTCAPAFRPAPS